MSKVAKIIILTAIGVITVSALAFYALRSKAPVTSVEAPVVSNPAPKAPTASKPQQGEQLPPLPADNKQAIESEIKSIDQTLQEVETTLDADMDEELGL